MQNHVVSPDTTGLPSFSQHSSKSVAAVTWMPASVDTTKQWRRSCRGEGEEEVVSWYSADPFGIIRDAEGIPQVEPGSVTPITYLDLHEDTQAVYHAPHIACGLAASAWLQVGGAVSVADRDVVLGLVADACPIDVWTNGHTFCLTEHEVQAARDRVATRLSTDLEFTRSFGAARAIMTAACAFFPWYKRDGSIPA